jgi:hypothetical protein
VARNLVSGQHRNLELAQRHRAALARENPGAEIKIVARRDASGKFSKHGRAFQFEIVTGEREVANLEEFFEEYDDAEAFETENWEDTPSYGEAE